MSAKKQITKILRHGLEMRSSFDFSQFPFQKWFPGHMFKGTMGVHSKLTQVDCIIEVHDARIPFSGRNNDIVKAAAMVKPRILIFNKMDKITKLERRRIEEIFSKENHSVLFSNCKDQFDPTIGKLVPSIIDKVNNSNRFQREGNLFFNVMVMGVPNVGKSSLINMVRNRNLKKRRGTPVGKNPGITKSVLTKIRVS